ncbi:FtsX-like permease family protein [Pelomonas sp. SE-A7]|uniref:ABC transporter permease n=1 Tax=Pelomonas sp. SE-A7 TaxID=3054953 RepID=UPI00259CF0B0|nr:FtsX-like permease family protein [Pelomonas sp. SE-A7]MDM4764472.1 ABC transporter permease [Pelomonas sp. SE-A7]
MPENAAASAVPPSALVLAWRQFWRDARAGELRLLMLAVMLAVAALCSVGFLSDRLDQGLKRDAGQLLGGDALVSSDQPTPVVMRELARELGLDQAGSAAFPSMARAPDEQGGASRLVAVKSVETGYPLRGRLQLEDGRSVGVPPRGEAWVDPAVLDALGLQVGQTVLLGDSRLRIAGVIRNEPDRGAGFMNFAPRLMIHAEDLAATGLIQPASRVGYRLAVAGSAAQSEAIKAFVERAAKLVETQKLRGIRLESLENGRPEMRQTLDRAGKFLNLVAMLAALLAAVAVALAARDFASRHLDDCAMLRVLGQPQRRIAWTYALEFGSAGLIASLAGVALGFALHYGFVALLSGLIDVSLPMPSARPGLLGLGLGLSLLLGFGLPPVLQLAAVPPLRVMRRELGSLKAGSLLVLGSGVLGFGAILMAIAADVKLGLISALGFAVALGLFALLAWLAVLLLRKLVPISVNGNGAPRWLLLATRQVAARPVFAIVQVSSLAVGLLALALLVLLRTDLIDSWRSATPADAPDRFVINVMPEQGESFRQRLEAGGVGRLDWYPMIRGRLVELNGKPIGPKQFKEDRAQRLVEREFNLSHMTTLPAHNQLVRGEWKAEDQDGLSVEQGLAEQLGLKLGDRLTFDVAGQKVEGRVTNLRKVDWSSMRVNFFVLFQREQMAELPSTFIAAYKSPKGRSLDAALTREFPNITVVDVSAQIKQVQQVLDQVIQAVQFLFAFTLATGLVVLLAAVTSTRDARTREYALMRALGASGRLLAQVQRAELLGLGALAGGLAGAVALLLGWLLARYVFEFSWNASAWVPLASALAGALLAQAAGWWGLRGVLTRPVVATLREADTQ